MKERITELELRSMHQENTIQELNETVIRQEQALERIERELAMLRHQIGAMTPLGARDNDREEPPPHY